LGGGLWKEKRKLTHRRGFLEKGENFLAIDFLSGAMSDRKRGGKRVDGRGVGGMEGVVRKWSRQETGEYECVTRI